MLSPRFRRAMAMPRPAKPGPDDRDAHLADGRRGCGAGAGWVSSVLVTDRLLEVRVSGLLSNAQQATTAGEQCSIRAPPDTEEHTAGASPYLPAGRSVLITGAARGIGAELARKAAARGARVALVGLEPERLAALADELGPSTCGWRPTSPTPRR